MRINKPGKVDKAKVQEILNNQDFSKSRKMKELFLLGLEVKTISELMGVRYNFVYNVISNLIRMENIEVEKAEKTGKKDQIIALFLQGKTNTEIASELKTNYQYVYKTIKDYKRENPDVEPKKEGTSGE